jgi:hypothetical protein
VEAHTPKRYAVERYLQSESARTPGWTIRVNDEQDSPVVCLQATKSESAGEPPRTLEIHTRQVILEHDSIDDHTQTMIRRWLDSLKANTAPVNPT